MEMQYRSYVWFLFCTNIFFIVCAAKESQNHAVSTKRWFNNIWNIFFMLFIVKICHILTRYILMLGKVIICSVCDTPQFAPSKWEEKFNICSTLAVEAKFFRCMISCSHLIFFDTKSLQPVDTERSPVVEPVKVCTWFTEEFQFHLFKLTCTECKVTRCNLVTERFTDLSDTKWNLLSGCSLYVFEVYKNSLCSLRS